MARPSLARAATVNLADSGTVRTIENLLIDIVGVANVDTGADIGADDTLWVPKSPSAQFRQPSGTRG